MYSPEDIKAMTIEEAQAVFNRLAEEYYGHDRWKVQFAKDTNTTPQGVANWFRETGRPPTWALMLLENWLEVRKLSKALKGISAAIEVANSL